MKKKLTRNTPAEEAAINKAIAIDPDTLEATDEQFKTAKRGRPFLSEETRKKQVTMRLDTDVIERLKEGGRGWQTRANEKLREALGL